MTRKKTILFVAVFLCLMAGGSGYYLYNKPRTTAAEAHTDDSVTARELYGTYAKDEKTAGKLYENKVLEVTGIVMNVEQNGKEVSVLLSAGETNPGGVNCSLADNSDQLPKNGETIRVKGRCTGFLMDVSLVDATILSTK
ncbi:hypothetical protein [[Flexibacter] sp. ATCC 35208]|uniref:OB-fold protein n=1 Tax=[Flexibacter] sp. ATCC 35208 TaxID=1936242 RepID=UPI0009CD7760|nr:hypothetical protein [[Flexibacter] sp. ATCC 35208]OMP79707.1 hypothetical protein BW716_08290 [[Flexibacter] sp. ATCC 35208]